MKKIIFFNIGWMERYQGLKGDGIQGGGKHIENEGWGGEVFNFKNQKGICYGYVQPKISSNGDAFSSIIKIDRLEAGLTDDSIDDVLVVFTSKDPINKGTRVIGWYKNATVYRESKFLRGKARVFEGNNLPYFVKAKVEDTFLLPVDSRIEKVPRGKNGMGQSNVWYCEENDIFRKRILKIVSEGGKIKASKRGKVSIDVDKRQKVERNAIDHVSNYYAILGYDVFSVEKDNVGWDLEVIKGKEKLLVEVKGLSNEFISVDFTSNEYEKMSDKLNRAQYRIAVVSNALNKERDFYLFNYSNESSNWVCQLTKKTINIDEKVSARLFLE
ncbi:protein NO VEIN domain-containing protein [Myroides odoratimimus]|uniref:protein NO VEIN domain-containing protein n=1 Tax=Myroides odoratimimus TaxID=76832 RepID=UPI0029BFBDCA|nr:DUF3883 domain-containing protein [Myroides odoratimimus]MDX4973927.1 DUF3883 domain-containing protein [Myroides odoratimimus]